MRVSSRMMVENAIRHMQDNLERLGELQERIASTKRFGDASGDPGAATAALGLRSSLHAHQAYQETARLSADWLDANELALERMVGIASRGLTLAKTGLSDTQGAAERRAMGTELDALLREAADVGNSVHRGGYLFAGFKTATTPYAYDVASGVLSNLPSTAGAIQHAIAPDQTVTVNLDGNTVFRPLFDALLDAREALNGDDPAALQSAVTELQSALDGVSAARTGNGARRRQVQEATDRMERTRLLLKSLLSQHEDLDMAESISRLKHQETVYQAVLEVGRRAFPTSLFDFLR